MMHVLSFLSCRVVSVLPYLGQVVIHGAHVVLRRLVIAGISRSVAISASICGGAQGRIGGCCWCHGWVVCPRVALGARVSS